jgi:hypothetical protein
MRYAAHDLRNGLDQKLDEIADCFAPENLGARREAIEFLCELGAYIQNLARIQTEVLRKVRVLVGVGIFLVKVRQDSLFYLIASRHGTLHQVTWLWYFHN